MAVDLEAVLRQARQLSSEEKLRLIAQLSADVVAHERIEEMRQMDLRARRSPSLDEIIQEQGTQPWHPPTEAIWPEDEDVEDFLSWRKQQRRMALVGFVRSRWLLTTRA